MDSTAQKEIATGDHTAHSTSLEVWVLSGHWIVAHP